MTRPPELGSGSNEALSGQLSRALQRARGVVDAVRLWNDSSDLLLRIVPDPVLSFTHTERVDPVCKTAQFTN
jgi:hypothetical protein